MEKQKKKHHKRINKKPVQSIQMNLPIREIADGIVITKDNRYVQIMEIVPTNFMMKSDAIQNNIINEFAALLKVAPYNLHFKCITCAADMTNQISILAKHMQTEENDKCYELQQEQMRNLHEMQEQGISRRFFLAVEHEDANVFKKKNYYDIRDKLKRTRAQIASYLESCGNSLVLKPDETEQTGEILYSILNRKDSRFISFEDRIRDVYSKYIHSGKVVKGEIPYIPPTDFISPQRIDLQNSDFISIDGTYYCFCYIPTEGYNPIVVDGWLNLFINLGEGIDIDVYLNKIPRDKVVTQIRRSIKSNEVAAIGTGETQDAAFYLDKALHSGNYLLNGLNNSQDFHYMSIMITVMADSPAEVDLKVKELQKIAIARNFKIKVCRYEQEQAFMSSLPLCKLDEGIYNKAKRNGLTEDIASVFPFMSYELNDSNGILWGLMENNFSPVIIDQFDHTKYVNGNLFITGVTGAGKSSLLKALALRTRMRKVPVYIIVPEKQDEFRRICDAVGGQFIEIGAGSPTRINIMEIFKHDETAAELLDDYKFESSLLVAKVQDLKNFFQLLIPDMTYEEKQILDTALMKTYAKKGITADNSSLIPFHTNSSARLEMPIIGDLHETLLEMGITRLANIIQVLVTGSGASFNGKTNVNLNNDFMVFGLERTNEELLPASMFMAVDFIYNKIKEDKSKQKVLFIEELWKLMLNSNAAAKVLEISKLIRAYGGSLVLATQQLKDITSLAGGTYGEGIVNSCAFKIVLKHNEADIDMLVNIMKLSVKEAMLTIDFSRGTGLVVAGGDSIVVDFKLSPKEYDLITTDPRDLAKRKEQRIKELEEKQMKHMLENIYDLEFENIELFDAFSNS